MSDVFDYPFNVRAVAKDGGPMEILALAIHVDVAKAAYEAALLTRDLRRYTVCLCNGARVMKESG